MVQETKDGDVKNLLETARESEGDPYLAPLESRNSPLDRTANGSQVENQAASSYSAAMASAAQETVEDNGDTNSVLSVQQDICLQFRKVRL